MARVIRKDGKYDYVQKDKIFFLVKENKIHAVLLPDGTPDLLIRDGEVVTMA